MEPHCTVANMVMIICVVWLVHITALTGTEPAWSVSVPPPNVFFKYTLSKGQIRKTGCAWLSVCACARVCTRVCALVCVFVRAV